MFKMMKKLKGSVAVTTLSATIFAALMSSAVSAGDGLNRTINLVNASHYSTITHVYITDRDYGGWGPDLLDWDEVLFPGYYRPVAPFRDRGYCMFDLKVVFDTGLVDELWNVNLCETYEIDVNDYGFSWIFA
ncbi:MAG: hypothetical protein AAF986_08095 [Pseudomonadota bacterium]